jgi:hypothetical protein
MCCRLLLHFTSPLFQHACTMCCSNEKGQRPASSSNGFNCTSASSCATTTNTLVPRAAASVGRGRRRHLAVAVLRLLRAAVLTVQVGGEAPDAERRGHGLLPTERVAEHHHAADHVGGQHGGHAHAAVQRRRQVHHPRGAHEAGLPRHNQRGHQGPVRGRREVPARQLLPPPASRGQPGHRQRRRGGLHDHLHLHRHAEPAGHRPAVHQLHHRQVGREQPRGAERHREAREVPGPAPAVGALARVGRPERQQHGAEREEHHGIEVGEGERVAHDDGGQHEREGQLRGQQQRGGGHGQVRGAVREEQVVHAHKHADDQARGQQPPREPRERPGLGGGPAGVDGHEQDWEPDRLHQRGHPPIAPAVREVVPGQQAGRHGATEKRGVVGAQQQQPPTTTTRRAIIGRGVRPRRRHVEEWGRCGGGGGGGGGHLRAELVVMGEVRREESAVVVEYLSEISAGDLSEISYALFKEEATTTSFCS